MFFEQYLGYRSIFCQVLVYCSWDYGLFFNQMSGTWWNFQLKVVILGNNNNNNVPFLYSAYHIQMASPCARGIITPALALMQPFSAKSIRRNKFPFTTPGSRETIVDKMPCLRAYAPSGIRTPTFWLQVESKNHYTPVFPHYSNTTLLYCLSMLWRSGLSTVAVKRNVPSRVQILLGTRFVWPGWKLIYRVAQKECNDFDP